MDAWLRQDAIASYALWMRGYGKDAIASYALWMRGYGKDAIASYALWMRGYGKDAIASYNAKSDLALSIAACDTSLPESICAISVMRCSSVSCVIVDTVPCSVSCFATL